MLTVVVVCKQGCLRPAQDLFIGAPFSVIKANPVPCANHLQPLAGLRRRPCRGWSGKPKQRSRRPMHLQSVYVKLVILSSIITFSVQNRAHNELQASSDTLQAHEKSEKLLEVCLLLLQWPIIYFAHQDNKSIVRTLADGLPPYVAKVRDVQTDFEDFDRNFPKLEETVKLYHSRSEKTADDVSHSMSRCLAAVNWRTLVPFIDWCTQKAARYIDGSLI